MVWRLGLGRLRRLGLLASLGRLLAAAAAAGRLVLNSHQANPEPTKY